MADASDSIDDKTGLVLAADGTPLKKSLQRALRAQKMRALLLIAPLLIFVLISFIMPIGQMLWRSVENDIVSETLPDTVRHLAGAELSSGDLPPEEVFEALYFDMFLAAEAKTHTRLGTRLNYEETGMSSLFRQSGRKLGDLGKDLEKELKAVDRRLERPRRVVRTDVWRDDAARATRSLQGRPRVASRS